VRAKESKALLIETDKRCKTPQYCAR